MKYLPRPSTIRKVGYKRRKNNEVNSSEVAIFTLLSEGMNIKEISHKLDVSYFIVTKRMRSAEKVLGAKSSYEAIIKLERKGILK